MPSTFQTLPDLIIRSIIECMLPPKRTTFGHATHLECVQWYALVPLFHICRIWRIVFLPYLCSDYSIRWTRYEKSILCILLPWTDLFGPPNFKYAHMVRTVSMKLEFFGVIGGSVNSFIHDNLLSKGLVFSGVHTLRISTFFTIKTAFDYYNSEMLMYNASMSGLNGYLIQLLPNIQKVCVTSLHKTENLPIDSNVFQAYFCFLNSCIAMAKGQVNFVSFRHRVPVTLGNTDQCCGLTHIHIHNIKCLACYTLIRRCSSTLISLYLHQLPDNNISGLVNGSKSNVPTVYSKLRHLDLCIDGTASSIILAKFPEDVIPFHSLESLHFTGIYPFEDDTLFRGNRKSLKRLSLKLAPKLADILIDQNVFSGGAYCHLFWIELEVDLRGDLERTFVEYQLLLENISRYARMLTCKGIGNEGYSPANYMSVAVFMNLWSVRRLTIRGVDVNIKEIVMLVGDLPNLSYLCCSLRELRDKSWLEVKVNSVVNQNFETLVIISKTTTDQELIRMVGVLTKECPNFRCIGTEWRLGCPRWLREASDKLTWI